MSYIQYNDVTIKTIEDVLGRTSLFTSFGENIITFRRFQVAAQFHYNLSNEDFNMTTTNSGSLTVSNSMLNCSSGTTINSTASISSRCNITYESGCEIFCLFTAIFDTPITGTYQRIGAFDSNDGFFIGYDINNDFSVYRRKGAVDYPISQSNFNLDKLDGSGSSGFNLDTSKTNLYMISFGWLGIAPITFWVNGGASIGWIPFHVIDLINNFVGSSINNPVLPITAQVSNGNTQSNILLRSICWSGGIHKAGEEDADLRKFSQDSLKTITSNSNTNIMTLKNNTVFMGSPNKIAIYINSISYTTDGGSSTKPVKIYVYKNATFGGTAQYLTIDSDSVMTYNTSSTVYLTGKLLLCIGVISNGGGLYELDKPIKIFPGETISFCALCASANTVQIAVNWEENF